MIPYTHAFLGSLLKNLIFDKIIMYANFLVKEISKCL